MRTLLPALLLVGGCEFLRDAGDVVEGAVDPLVAVGLVAHVEEPDALPDGVELPDDLQTGNTVTLFLADARDVTDLAEAPVAGAELELLGCDDAAVITDDGDGSYATVAALPGCPGPSLAVDGVAGDRALTLPVTLPAEQDPGVPATWTAGDDLVLALDGADWNAAVVVVVDLQAREVTYTSEPEGITGWYQLLKGQQDLSAVTIPGSAFRADRLHTVAVTGLRRTPGADLDGVNTLLTTVDGGRTTVTVVSTRRPPG